MGDKKRDGTPKAVYYQPSDLTAEELTRYYQFETPLTEEQLRVVQAWYKENTSNFAIVDDDYIFFTLKSEHDAFAYFWEEYAEPEEASENVFVETQLALA